MADLTTRPVHATRLVEAARGLLSRAELAPLLTERVQRLPEGIHPPRLGDPFDY